MNRSYTKALALSIAGIGLASIGLLAVAEPKDDAKQPVAPAFKPVTSVHDMMEGQDKLFREIKDALLDKKWSDAAKSAWVLAEIGNVNQYQNDDPQYKTFAREMSDACVTLAQALKKRDEAASKDAVKAVGARCGACHDQFKK